MFQSHTKSTMLSCSYYGSCMCGHLSRAVAKKHPFVPSLFSFRFLKLPTARTTPSHREARTPLPYVCTLRGGAAKCNVCVQLIVQFRFEFGDASILETIHKTAARVGILSQDI